MVAEALGQHPVIRRKICRRRLENSKPWLRILRNQQLPLPLRMSSLTPKGHRKLRLHRLPFGPTAVGWKHWKTVIALRCFLKGSIMLHYASFKVWVSWELWSRSSSSKPFVKICYVWNLRHLVRLIPALGASDILSFVLDLVPQTNIANKVNKTQLLVFTCY